jgi:hypothetical protein
MTTPAEEAHRLETATVLSERLMEIRAALGLGPASTIAEVIAECGRLRERVGEVGYYDNLIAEIVAATGETLSPPADDIEDMDDVLVRVVRALRAERDALRAEVEMYRGVEQECDTLRTRLAEVEAERDRALVDCAARGVEVSCLRVDLRERVKELEAELRAALVEADRDRLRSRPVPDSVRAFLRVQSQRPDGAHVSTYSHEPGVYHTIILGDLRALVAQCEAPSTQAVGEGLCDTGSPDPATQVETVAPETRALLVAVVEQLEEPDGSTWPFIQARGLWERAGKPNITPPEPAPEALGEAVQRALPTTPEGNALVDDLLAQGRSAECRPLTREATDDDYETRVDHWRYMHQSVAANVRNAIDERVRLERGRGR